jgi:23S rRNA maturation-related 3'-5' exoribonuclease YhaM
MNYQQFRTEMVSKGCIVHGDMRVMTVFSPRARLELSYIGEMLGGSRYTVYDFTQEVAIEGTHSLVGISEMILAEIGITDLYSWYGADWRVSYKGHSLYLIGQLIESAEATLRDIALSLQICDDMKYLILMSDLIPDEMKANLCKDVLIVKDQFSKTIV